MFLKKCGAAIFKNGGFILAYIILALVYLLSLQFTPVTLTLEMKVSAKDTGQLFYDHGFGFRESNSISFPVDNTDDFANYQLLVPRGRIVSLRIDPMTQEGTFSIRSISFEASGKLVKLEGERLRDSLVPLNQVEFDYAGGIVRGIATGVDPFFGFTGIRLANRFPLYITLPLLLALLLLTLAVRKFFFNQQYELSFAVFLLAFALPASLPLYFSLALALMAVLNYIYLQWQPGIIPASHALDSASALKGSDWCKNRRLTEFCCLGLALLLAFMLRITNLTILDPYTDEYSHLLAAKTYLDTGALTYTRASLVTWLTAFFYRIGNASSFYEYLHWGRVPGVIFSSLTVIPLYYLARKISRPVALISVFLWATSPWAIGVSKTIREYAFYPFFILLAAFSLVKSFDLLFMYKIKQLHKTVLFLLPAVALVVFAFGHDVASTLRICAIVFASIACYYCLVNIDRLNALPGRARLIAYCAILLLGSGIAVLMIAYANKTGHVSITDVTVADYWFRVFFVPGSMSVPMHWWGNFPFTPVAVFLGAIGFFYAVSRKNRGYFLHLVVFSVLLIFYIFFFNRYGRPRYIFYALPFFIPLVATAVYAILDFARQLKPFYLKIAGIAFAAIFLFQTFNYQNILYPLFSDEHGYIKTTNEHHDSLKSIFELLEKEATSEDVFITTIASSMLILSGIDPERIHSYNYKDKNRFEKVERIVNENSQGYMILDWRRNGHFAEGYPKEGQFMIGDTLVEVIQNKEGMQVYRWKR